MSNLAHFTLGSLNDLISEDFFNVDDYVDVKFIAPSKNTKLSSFRLFFVSFTPQIMMRITNKFPHNISIASANEVFFFDPIITDKLGLCFTFNSRIAAYLSPR